MRRSYKPGWKWDKTPEDVADILGVCVQTVCRKARSGELPSRNVFRKVRFCEEELWEHIGKSEQFRVGEKEISET